MSPPKFSWEELPLLTLSIVYFAKIQNCWICIATNLFSKKIWIHHLFAAIHLSYFFQAELLLKSILLAHVIASPQYSLLVIKSFICWWTVYQTEFAFKVITWLVFNKMPKTICIPWTHKQSIAMAIRIWWVRTLFNLHVMD